MSELRTSAPAGAFRAYNVSHISNSPADTNLFMLQGRQHNIGHFASAPLEGINGRVPSQPSASEGCAIYAPECPPLTLHFQGSCVGTVATLGTRLPFVSP